MNFISKTFQLPFIKKDRITSNIWTFYFDLTGIEYDFYPGQYNDIILPIHAEDGKGSMRSFTVTSSPLDKSFLQITTTISKSDFKKALFALKKHELVSFRGPLGGFYLREKEKQDKVFLAGGMGITSFISMLRYIDKNHLSQKIKLFASFSHNEDVILHQELLDIAKRNAGIEIIFTVSNASKSNSEGWSGEKGRISKELLEKYISKIHESLYYIVGSTAFLDGMEVLLQEMGIKEENVKTEHFTGY